MVGEEAGEEGGTGDASSKLELQLDLYLHFKLKTRSRQHRHKCNVFFMVCHRNLQDHNLCSTFYTPPPPPPHQPSSCVELEFMARAGSPSPS